MTRILILGFLSISQASYAQSCNVKISRLTGIEIITSTGMPSSGELTDFLNEHRSLIDTTSALVERLEMLEEKQTQIQEFLPSVKTAVTECGQSVLSQRDLFINRAGSRLSSSLKANITGLSTHEQAQRFASCITSKLDSSEVNYKIISSYGCDPRFVLFDSEDT